MPYSACAVHCTNRAKAENAQAVATAAPALFGSWLYCEVKTDTL